MKNEKENLTFAILYGLAEGPYQSKELVRQLEENGYGQTSDVNAANILICHSGGAYLVPKHSAAQVVLLIGLPYWPGRSVISSILRKWWLEKKDARWIQKMTYHLLYVVRDLPGLVRMAQARRALRLPLGKRRKVLLVRNSRDVFLEPASGPKLAEKYGWEYIELPGQHDDLWENPKPYVELVVNSLAS